jgi:hypothetical protein
VIEASLNNIHKKKLAKREWNSEDIPCAVELINIKVDS